MDTLEAVILGIIQGLTEFLPISSTAHLRVIPALVGWGDPGAAFTAVIQIGTLLAVMIYFFPDMIRLFTAWVRGMQTRRSFAENDSKLAWMIIVGTVPIVVGGVLFQKYIKETWRSLYVIGTAAVVFGLLMLVAEIVAHRRQRGQHLGKTMANLGWTDSLVVGMLQAMALVPGASRSGVTITGGLFTGMSRETAARFSFLLSLPSVFAAGVYELYKEGQELLRSSQDATNLVLATVISGVVGYATIAFLLGFLRTHSTYVFIGYRLMFGVTLLVLVWRGILPA